MQLTGKRPGRRIWMWLGVVVLVGSLATCGILAATLGAKAESYLPMIGIGGMIAWWLIMMLGLIKRTATIDLDLGLAPRPIVLGRLIGHLNTRAGITAELGDRVIGGLGHAGRGLTLHGRSRRRVDLEVDVASFDALLARLGVVPEERVETLELVRSSQGAGGVFRMMLPWLLTIVVTSVVSVGIGLTAWGQALEATPQGRLGIPMAIGVMVVIGLVVTVVVNARMRDADRFLRLGDALVWSDRKRELARAPWSQVVAKRTRHVVRARGMSFEMPVCTLTIGVLEVRVGPWDQTHNWEGDVPRGRAATWLIGVPQWDVFIEALKRHRLL